MAIAYVRSSQLFDRFTPHLRKCSAIVNRTEASGVIVQRIIGSEPRVLAGLNWVLNALSFDEASVNRSLTDAIELLGWPMVREISLTVLLHEIHCEAGPRIKMAPSALDRRALAVLSAGTEIGANSHAALFANIGELVMAIIEEAHGAIRRQTILTPEDVVRGEHDAFGFDHGALGSAMLTEVDFPPEVCNEVLQHTTVGRLIWTAEHLAADLGFRGPFDRGFPSIDLWARLQMSPRRQERFKASILSAGELPELAFVDTAIEAA